MKKLLILSLFMAVWACKLPELPSTLQPLIEPSNLTLDSKFALTDPMVHVGLQTGAVTNDGTVMANENEVIKVWNYANKTLLQTLKGHKELVIDMVLSPGETQLFSIGLNENNILVWDWKNGKLLKTLTVHSAQINCIRISADGKYLASVSMDGTARIWDAINGNLIRTITGIETNNPNTKISICNDAKYIAVLQSKSFVVYDGKTGAEYWRKEDTNIDCIGKICGYATEWGYENIISQFSDILLDKNGTRFYLCNGNITSWNLVAKKFEKFYLPSGVPAIPGSDIIPSFNNHNTLFSVQVFAYFGSNRLNISKKINKLSNDERYLIFNGGVYNFANNRIINDFKGVLNENGTKILQLSNDYINLVENVEVINIINSSREKLNSGLQLAHTQLPLGINSTKNGGSLYSYDNEYQIKAWYMPTKRNLYSLTNVLQFETKKIIGNNTNILAVSSSKIKLYDAADAKTIKEFDTNGYTSTPAFSHDEKSFYADSKIYNSVDGSKKLDLPIIEGIVLFTLDDRQLVNLNSQGEIKVYDAIGGKPTKSFLTVANSTYMRMSISKDDKNVVISTDKEVFIYSLSDGKLIGSFVCKPAFTNSTTVEYNSKFDVIALATTDKKVQLWSANTKKMLSEITFDFEVINVQFNEDGKKLYVATQKDFYQYNLQ